jgi:isopentenyl diphosphate isomerase/L-lactate dehydrogenase-like FMN-dependent dehydrogenase
VWGLALGGQEGVREVIRNLRADFDLTMGLSGVAAVRDIGRESITRA